MYRTALSPYCSSPTNELSVPHSEIPPQSAPESHQPPVYNGPMEIFPPVPGKNVLPITGEKEILCHFLHRKSLPSIFMALQVSRNTVSKAVTTYQVQGLEPGAVSVLPDKALHRQLFPHETDFLLLPGYLPMEAGASSLVAEPWQMPFRTGLSRAPTSAEYRGQSPCGNGWPIQREKTKAKQRIDD